MQKKDNEQQIVKQILKGDTRTLRRFYETHRKFLFSLIKQNIGNSQDAEEILQDTFLSTIDNLDHFLGTSGLRGFLIGIARHKIVDYYRKRKIKCLFFSQHPILENVLLSMTIPEEEFEKEISKEIISRVFKKLLPHHRKILIQKYIHGFSVKEIARLNNYTIKQAESLLWRARKIFKQEYDVVIAQN